MRRAKISAVAALIVLICGCAFGLVTECGDIGARGATYWPAGLADLLNSRERVYCYQFTFNDWIFYQGDAKTFQQFLDRFARLKGVPISLVVHPGRGTQKRVSSVSQETVDFDWSVSLDLLNVPPESMSKPEGRRVVLDAYTGGNIDWNRVKVPKGLSTIDLRSGHRPR